MAPASLLGENNGRCNSFPESRVRLWSLRLKAASPINSALNFSSGDCCEFFLMKKCHGETQAEKKKAGPADDGHGNPEIERLRKEVQDTKEINRKLRDLLQVSLSLSNLPCQQMFHHFIYTQFFCLCRCVPGASRSVVGRREAQSLHGCASVGETGQGGRSV